MREGHAMDPMHRYHLEFAGPDGTVLVDTEGDEFPALDVASAQARDVIRTVLQQAAPDQDWSEWTTTIKDGQGNHLAVVRFREIMESSGA
jgi:hypothetical protein